jgi:hypothetical protein
MIMKVQRTGEVGIQQVYKISRQRYMAAISEPRSMYVSGRMVDAIHEPSRSMGGALGHCGLSIPGEM